MRLSAVALSLALPAVALAGAGLPVRAARPVDDAMLSQPGWAEEWRVLAFEPGGPGYLSLTLASGPVPFIQMVGRAGTETVRADAELPNGLLAHQGPGVTIANLPDGAPPQANSLSYAAGRYVVDLTWPAQGHLTIRPVRAGVTVGPWRLGGEPVVRGGPPTYVPGRLSWSVPVALGTASGSVAADGHRISFSGWRAYHDHIWGRFRRSSSSWTHWDFAVVAKAHDAWILDGLEPTDGRYFALPSDRRWQGVLVHATPRRVTTCQARIVRRGWDSYRLNLTGASFDYWLPTYVRALCGKTALSVRTAARPWPLFGGFGGGVLAASPLPAGNGWIEHAVPVVPTS